MPVFADQSELIPLEEELPPEEQRTISPGLGGGPVESDYVPSPGLGGVPEPEYLPPPPGPVEGAIQSVQGAVAPVGEAILEAVPEPIREPVRNVANIVGQPVGGAVEAAGEIATGIGDEGASGGIQAGLEAVSEPFNRIPEEAARRVATDRGVMPTATEVLENPGALLSAAAVLPTTIIPRVLGMPGIEEWAQGNPDTVRTAQLQGGDIEVMDTYIRDVLGGEAVPPPTTSNPFDAATDPNKLVQASQVMGAIPEMLGGWGQSVKQGTIKPFLISQGAYLAMDPTTLIPPSWGAKVSGAAGRAVGRIPGVSKITSLSKASQAALAAEKAGAAGQELLTATERAANAPAGAVVPPTAAATTLPTNGNISPPTNGNIAPPTNGSTPPGVALDSDLRQRVGAQGVRMDDVLTMDEAVKIQEGRNILQQRRDAEQRRIYESQRPVNQPATYSPTTGARQEVQAPDPALTTALRDHLRAAGWDDYQLRTVDRLESVLPASDLKKLQGGTPQAMHERSKKLITLALENDRIQGYIDRGVSPEDARRITTTAYLDHEIMHATRQADLFTAPEWESLVRAADEQGLLKRITDDPSYSKLSGQARVEESVAHLYQYWREGRMLDLDPATQGLLDRVFTFLSRIGRALKDTTPERVLKDLESGVIGQRTRRPVSMGTEPDFSQRRAPEVRGGYDTTGYRAALDSAEPRYLDLRGVYDGVTSSADDQRIYAKAKRHPAYRNWHNTRDGTELPVSRIPLDPSEATLIGTSSNVQTNKVLALMERPEAINRANMPIALKDGDTYYIEDGHHRVTAARINGDESVPAFVFDVNEGRALGDMPAEGSDFASIRRSPSFESTLDEIVPEPDDTAPTKTTLPINPRTGEPSNPRFHMENREQFVGPGPGARGLDDFQVKDAWDRTLAEFPNHGLEGARPVSAAQFEQALSQDWDQLLFYEDGARKISQHLNVPTGLKNQFFNLFGALSRNTKPDINYLRTLSAMAEEMQGVHIRTPAHTPYSVAKAVTQTHLDSPKYFTFSNTFKNMDGMIDSPAGTVVDQWMAKAVGLPDNKTLSREGYQALARFFENVRDQINAGSLEIPPLDPPLQTWHVQQGVWDAIRGPDPRGNPIVRGVDKAITQIKAAGIPLGPGDTMIPATFLDSRMIELFGHTAEFVAEMPYATFSEMNARGVVGRAYQQAATLSPRARATFRREVEKPFRDGFTQKVWPAIMRAALGEYDLSMRAPDVSRVIAPVGETGKSAISLGIGGTTKKGMQRIPRTEHLELIESMLRERMGIADVEVIATRKHRDPTAGPMWGESLTEEARFKNAKSVTEEQLTRLSAETGYATYRTAPKSGGIGVMFRTTPGEVIDTNRIDQAIHAIWPDESQVVNLHETIITPVRPSREPYDVLRARFISGNDQTISNWFGKQFPGGWDQYTEARVRNRGLHDAESLYDDLYADLERNSRRYLGEPDDATTDLAPDPGVALSDRDYAIFSRQRTAQRNAHVANIGAPQGYQRDLQDRSLAEPVQTPTGGYITKDADDLLRSPSGGRVRFRDGYTPRSVTLYDLATQMHTDVHEWLQGYDRLGQPESWTANSKDWQKWEARFNPNGDVDTTRMRVGTGNPEADTAAAMAREQFMHDVWADATRSQVDGASKNALVGAWDAYTGAIRPMILFNWLNGPRYVMQNIISNSINVTARGGGIGVAAGMFTDFRGWKGVFGNLRRGDPTMFNTLERTMGVGTSPNVQMNQNAYFKQMQKGPARGTKILGSLIAPEWYRHMLSVPDQYAREAIGVKAIERGFKELNAKMPAKIFKELDTRLGKTGIQIPQSKVHQVWNDFMKEKSTRIDPNTNRPYSGMMGKQGKFTPVYAAEDLRDYMFRRLDEDLTVKPDRKLYTDAIDRVFRDTKPQIKKIREDAAAQVDHALFDWRNTVGDEMLAKATLFHYWGSRQGGFYINEGIKHPWMITSYARMMTEMEEQSQELDAPTWLRGFFQFANSPAGLSTWHSPFDFFGSMLTMADWQFSGDPDAFRDLTALGQKMRQLPFFVHPGLQFVAYEMGLLGPDYPAPGITGAETFISKVGDLLNLANANDAPFMQPFNQMGIGVDASGNKVPIPTRPLNELYGRVGNAISTALAPLTGLNPVEVISPTASFDRNLRTLGATQVRGQHPDWEETQVLDYVNDIIGDPSSPEYQDWYRRAAEMPFTTGNLPQPLAGLARIASPVGITAAPEQRLLDTMSGLNPSGNITTASPENEFVANRSKYGMSSTVEGDKLAQWNNEFKSLVDPVVRDARYTAPDITGCRPEGCDLTEPITIGGYEYTPDEIMNMDYATKKGLRAQYLLDVGVEEAQLTDSYQAEQRYLDAHPDYAAYHEYESLVYSHPGGAQGFVEETMMTNPGFAQHVRNEMTDYATGAIDYGRANDPDSYLAAQGVRPSVYSPVVGNEPTTTPGGYPSIAGVESGRPILDSVTTTVDAPLTPGPYDDVTAETTIVGPGHPLQVLDPTPINGTILVGSLDGEYVGFVDAALLEVTSPPKPNGYMGPEAQAAIDAGTASTIGPPGSSPQSLTQNQVAANTPAQGGGLVGMIGQGISALGGVKDAIGNALGAVTGRTASPEATFQPYGASAIDPRQMTTDYTGQQVIDLANKFEGVPYEHNFPDANDDPFTTGWDCSSFIHWLADNAGVSEEQYPSGPGYVGGGVPVGAHFQYEWAVDNGLLQRGTYEKANPGDMIFFSTDPGRENCNPENWNGCMNNDASHVGLYLGNDPGTGRPLMMHAAAPGVGTVYDFLDTYPYPVLGSATWLPQ